MTCATPRGSTRGSTGSSSTAAGTGCAPAGGSGWSSCDEAPDPPVPDGTGAAGERDALRRALAQLPADQRLAVALRYFGDRSLEEIAELTGERLGTVKSRLHYGLQALRAAYDAAGRLPGEGSR